jgi:hypothetical protein
VLVAARARRCNSLSVSSSACKRLIGGAIREILFAKSEPPISRYLRDRTLVHWDRTCSEWL